MRNLDIAIRFLDAIDRTVDLLRLHPESGGTVELPGLPPGIRALAVTDFRRFTVFYSYGSAEVCLVRCLYQGLDLPAVDF